MPPLRGALHDHLVMDAVAILIALAAFAILFGTIGLLDRL